MLDRLARLDLHPEIAAHLPADPVTQPETG